MLYNHKLPFTIIFDQIDISLFKKEKFEEGPTIIDNYFKMFNANLEVVTKKIKSVFSTTCDWLDETKEVNNTESVTKTNYAYLKIWKFLVEIVNWKSSDQFKLILARYHKDITVNCLKPIDNYFHIILTSSGKDLRIFYLKI